MTPIARILATAACISSLILPVFGQSAATPATAPAFEIADIHPSPNRAHPNMRGGMSHGDRFILKDATLLDLIAGTYEVDPSDVFGGPPWLAFDRFDILAKAPDGTSDKTVQPMVRQLLEDRFKLVAHAGTRPLPAFVLTAGKTLKLKQAEASAEPGDCQFQQQAPNPANGSARVMNINFSCHNTTMQSFAEFLHDVASPYLNRPVIDATGLKGGWDFGIEWTYQIPKDTDGITIFAAVDKQLGLKLESKTAPLPVVVIESVDKPTPNRADLDKVLPPPPRAEFDVAVIRPSNPDERNFHIDIEGNNVKILYGTLQTLIINAFGFPGSRMNNKPPFLNQQHWDIVGKASTDSESAPKPGGRAQDLDIDDVTEMLQSLLIDRFKLVTHQETQPADAYALVAAGPKMKKADPTNHPSCEEGPGPDHKDPRLENPLLGRLISCQNITMAELGGQLQRLAPGYVPVPVIDETKLEGAYDFTISFSKKGADTQTLARPRSTGGGDESGAAVASDPTLGGMSLYDALQKQLGLKLEKRDKVPVPALVIDHVEEQPTEN